MNIPNYLFLCSKERGVFERAGELYESNQLTLNSMNDGRQLLIASSQRIKNHTIYKTIINDFGIDGANKNHSLISFTEFDGNYLKCTADTFGVQTHYYFHNASKFIISNNLFVVAYLTNAKFSEESIFDAFIFKKPRREKTWFENIKCLIPGEVLTYEVKLHNLIIKKEYELFEVMFERKERNYDEVFINFFSEFKKFNECDNIGLSLSAGIDSRTVLAGLLTTGKNFTTYSWGGSNYFETKKIDEFVKNFNLKNQKITFEDLEQNYDKYTEIAFLNTSGLLTAVHQYYYYSKLPKNLCLFEGYLGSEFLKGELSDGMFTKIYYDIIKNNIHPKQAILIYFPNLKDNIKSKLIDYISATYGNTFKDVNTEAGKVEFQKYLLEFIPSKVFGGVLTNGIALGIKYFLPYFSPIFLKSLFGDGYGIVKNISLRNDHPGSIRIIEAQSKIVEKLNTKIYNSVLSRNIKFSESKLPYAISKILRKKRNLIDMILIKKYKVTAQVDYENIKKNSSYHTMKINDNIRSMLSAEIPNEFLSYTSFYLNVIERLLKDKYFSYLKA